jgi:hypothetical protein
MISRSGCWRRASLDIRDYVSIAELPSDLSRILNGFCQANPREALQSAFERFYFSETIEEIVPLRSEARTLEEFARGFARFRMPRCSFISSPRGCACSCGPTISLSGS